MRAYNGSRSRQNVYEKDVVLPVYILDDWKVNNPPPANTTGWYIPSLKELTLLCGNDVDDVWKNGFGKTTFSMINEILTELGDDYVDWISSNWYHSSTEFDNKEFEPFYVYGLYFSDATTTYLGKSGTYHICLLICFGNS